LAGAGLRAIPVSPNKALAASPATVADLIEIRFLGAWRTLPLRICRTER
jgi:hypothetical protein